MGSTETNIPLQHWHSIAMYGGILMFGPRFNVKVWYHHSQGSKFYSSDRLRRVKITVGQVEYLQDLFDARLHISGFHISCIGCIYSDKWMVHSVKWFLQSTCPTEKCIQFEISKPAFCRYDSHSYLHNGISTRVRHQFTYKYMSLALKSLYRADSSLRPANERHCYKVTPSLIGWAQA